MKTGRWAERSNMQEATGKRMVCSRSLVYSGIDAWRASEGGALVGEGMERRKERRGGEEADIQISFFLPLI